MAILLRNAGIYLHNNDLSGLSNTAAVESDRDMFDATSFGDQARSYLPGMMGIRFSAAGFYDPVNVDAALFDLKDVSQDLITTIVSDKVPGGVAYMLRGVVGTYAVGGEVNNPGTYTLQGQTTSTPTVRGVLLHRTLAVTATGNGTAVQHKPVLAADPDQTAYGTLHVYSASGTTPSLTARIESSADNTFGSPTARIIFDAATGRASQWKSWAGPTTDTWWRAAWTISGATPSFGFAVSFGVYPPAPAP